jgi:hypothetical protein
MPAISMALVLFCPSSLVNHVYHVLSLPRLARTATVAQFALEKHTHEPTPEGEQQLA